jgi:uracil permease
LIASVGIKTLIDSRTNLHEIRNQVIVSLVLTIGIGGAVISWGNFSLAGIGLAAVVGILLNLILPGESKQVVVEEE